MSFQVGDKVRFLNADGFGVITKVIDSNKVEVENEYGFEEIFNLKELVLQNLPLDEEFTSVYLKELAAKYGLKKPKNIVKDPGLYCVCLYSLIRG
mgnify:CR=1 FL=1